MRLGANPATVAALAIAAIAAATLAGAWFFQLVLDIRPCPLCLEQRYAYYLAIPLGAGGGVRRRAGMRRAACCWPGLPCSRLAALANAWLGGYHAGVEWKFWQGPTDCSGPLVDLGSAGTLLERLDTREGDPLRRGAVAFSRPVARRLQCADLAADGRDRGWGIVRRTGVASGGHARHRVPIDTIAPSLQNGRPCDCLVRSHQE